MMLKAVLLTGPPGCGKTTAIQQVLARLDCQAGGFYTQELREAGRRTGFKLITLDGREGVLAHIRIRGRPRVGKYGVDLGVMDELGSDSIERAVSEKRLVVIDEIGPMELLSERFRKAVLSALESEVRVLGTIMRRSVPFADGIKTRPGVRVINMRKQGGALVVEQVLGLLAEAGVNSRPTSRQVAQS